MIYILVAPLCDVHHQSHSITRPELYINTIIHHPVPICLYLSSSISPLSTPLSLLPTFPHPLPSKHTLLSSFLLSSIQHNPPSYPITCIFPHQLMSTIRPLVPISNIFPRPLTAAINIPTPIAYTFPHSLTPTIHLLVHLAHTFLPTMLAKH